MAFKYSLSHRVLEDLTADAPVMQKLGMATFNDLQAWFEALDLFEKIDVMMIAINNLETLDPLFSMVTRRGSDATHVEMYSRASFKKGAWDTMGKSFKPVLQEFTIPYDDYDCAVEVDRKMFKKNKEMIVDKIISDVYDAYKKLLRGLALDALITLPTDESKHTPSFWRDSSAFATANQLVPYPNGLKTFTNAETHYIGKAAMDDQIIKEITKKVRSKGYGRNGLVVVANENTWSNYEDQFTYDEVRKNELVEVSSDFAPRIGSTTYVTIPETDFPDNYVLCFDPTVFFLYHKEAEKEDMRGLIREFNNFEVVRTNNRAEFMVYETGMGIIEKGAGAVMYIGNATYQNPDLSTILG